MNLDESPICIRQTYTQLMRHVLVFPEESAVSPP